MRTQFKSGDITLHGHLAVPPGARESRPALVLCHGFPTVVGGGATATATMPELADRLAAAVGWVVLAFGFRGCRPSEGEFSLGGWLSDVDAAVASLAGHPDVAAIWAVGFGRGGALAICAAARNPVVEGVLACAPPADFEDWASQPRRLLEFARRTQVVHDPHFPRSFDEWSAELRVVHTVRSAELLAPRPLMVIHGLADAVVPVFDARVIVDAHGSAELRVIPGALHDLRLDPRAISVLGGWLDRQWNAFQTRR